MLIVTLAVAVIVVVAESEESPTERVPAVLPGLRVPEMAPVELLNDRFE